VNHSGPPDQIRIRARAADFTSAIRNRREQSWANTTLGTVLQDIAGRNALALRIAPDLAAIALPALHQSRESDTAFLRRLGRENDAVATIKTGTLIFARKGAGTTSTGQPLPTLALTRRSGDGHSWQRQTRDGQAGVTAHWHDRKAARHRAVTMGKAEGAKTLRKTYPDEASARRAATAEHTRLKRAPATLDMRLALGRPDAIPEARVTLTGFKPEIDATPWLITEVTHRLDNAGGFITELKMEVAGGGRANLVVLPFRALMYKGGYRPSRVTVTVAERAGERTSDLVKQTPKSSHANAEAAVRKLTSQLRREHFGHDAGKAFALRLFQFAIGLILNTSSRRYAFIAVSFPRALTFSQPRSRSTSTGART
jgi:phage protein D